MSKSVSSGHLPGPVPQQGGGGGSRSLDRTSPGAKRHRLCPTECQPRCSDQLHAGVPSEGDLMAAFLGLGYIPPPSSPWVLPGWDTLGGSSTPSRHARVAAPTLGPGRSQWINSALDSSGIPSQAPWELPQDGTRVPPAVASGVPCPSVPPLTLLPEIRPHGPCSVATPERITPGSWAQSHRSDPLETRGRRAAASRREQGRVAGLPAGALLWVGFLRTRGA